MRFSKYLADRKYSILCYLLQMLFISMVIYLGGFKRVSAGDLLYINLVTTTFFIIYLIAKFLHRNSYYKSLSDIVDQKSDKIFNCLPKPKSYEQVLFNEVLSSLNQAQIQRVQRLYDQKRDYEEFITSWVHQIKTPISVSRLLIENNMGNANKDTLLSLEEEIDKIDNDIEQFLYYSKLDDFSKDYLINEVNIDRIVKDAVKKQAKIFINKRISIDINNTDLMITSDRKWLSFILDQILSNALKYTSPEGRIKIYGVREDKVQKLILEDNGIGIKLEDLDRVFEKGFTGYNGRENSKSTGFGLYLSKQLARKLGHDIVIESIHGEYTKVTILFPKLTDYYKVIE